MRDVNHTRRHHVFVRRVSIKVGEILFQCAGIQFSVFGREDKHFMAGSLNGAGLMYINVSGLRRHYSFVRTQQSINNGGISLRPANEEVYPALVQPACFKNPLPGTSRIIILPIAYGLFQIGNCQTVYNLRMRPAHIICIKV